MRRLTPSDYRTMSWRSGGGTTTEILVEPRSAGLAEERFHYRMSIADVARDGPFSRFDGYDRHIMLLSGGGMTLDCGEHGRIELSTPFEPRSFAGDWDVQGSLIAGPTRDFNLIVDRTKASSSLDARVLSTPESIEIGAQTVCLVYVISGALSTAAEGDTLVIDAPIELAPVRTARVAIAKVVLR